MTPWRQPPTTSRLVLAWRILLLASPPALLVLVGLVTALDPPPSVEGGSALLLLSWSLVMTLGGLLVLVALFTRHRRSTVAGHALIAAGAGFYALALLWVPHGYAAAGLIGASALGALGEVARNADVARWRRGERAKARRRHPAAAGRRPVDD